MPNPVALAEQLRLISRSRSLPLGGAVVAVGKSSMPHERFGPVYPMRVRVHGNDVRGDGKPARLGSGMAASVESGARRISDSLWSPVVRASARSIAM